MKKLSPLAEWLRRQREQRGFRSAAALSRRAGLDPSYVSELERDKARPKSRTVRMLCKALGLSPAERTEFHRLAKLAGEPASIADALAGPPIPGLALWRHLAHALFQAPHQYPITPTSDPDKLFADVVPAAGSLLAWDALVQKPPTDNQCRKLRAGIIHVIDEASIPGLRGSVWDPKPPNELASVLIPHLWRSLLFKSDRAAAAHVARLDAWRYGTNFSPFARPGVSFTFKRRASVESLNVDLIDPELTVGFHDALIVDRLWPALALDQIAPGQPIYRTNAGLIGLREAIRAFPLAPLETVRAELGDAALRAPERIWDLLEVVARYAYPVRLMRFARRAAVQPRVAEYIFGPDWQDAIARAIEDAERVWEALKSSSPATIGEPGRPADAFWQSVRSRLFATG